SKICIFGTVEEKLSYFSFADETYNVDRLPDDISVDHAFECVGGYGSQPAINQIIDIINPEGSIALMGVSENNVALNTRMILEKGLRLFGSSRSSAEDFQKAVDLMAEHCELVRYFEYLVDGIVTVNSIVDLHKAFDVDFKRNFGKTVLKWEI
ncbi:MAG: zinc-binding dehydrogenase, partial [Clostridia bacterium]|nr:zinc-binding dehydrogenase [Clostridia bacterium]